jgi:signal transduction histidine kinase
VILHPTNILLVDDEARNLTVLEGVLQSAEHRLVNAANAEETLLALLQHDFAVIVLDVKMPGMDGIELAQLIKQRERSRHTPIIFLTAFYQDERRMLESYNVGAVDYLTKPVNPQVLRTKVAVFVDLHRKTLALRRSNEALGQEIVQRQAAENALREANDALEARVEARTAALREARDAAELSGRAKDDFLAALSHELRTPLNPVLLLASDAAENPAFPEEARAHFLTIRKNAELEARLIDDLLDLTRITRGKMTLTIQPHDIHRIIKDAIATVRAEIDERQLSLRLDLSAASSQVAVDDVRLQQVFWNLLKNAVKFTPPQGGITISSKVDTAANTVVISVTDTGIGLAADEIDRIFGAFAQGDHALAGLHRFGGLGLGLAISKSLTEHHLGRLTAHSGGTGQGATFAVELPLIAPGETAAPTVVRGTSATTAASARGKSDGGAGDVLHGRKLMLVEDHETTRKTLAMLLQRRHFDVSTAASLAEARVLATAQHFDFLISDIGLPDGTGFELLREMKVRQTHIRSIALTGYGSEEDIGRSRAAGFMIHLTKPVVIQSLDKALAELQG